MKVLFVDNSAELQQKVMEPLRKDGWVALRVRSVQDAERMMSLHSEGVEALVVNEKFVAFAENRDLPYIVLTQTWNENQILKHKNVSKPAFAYFKQEIAVSELKGALDSYVQGIANAGSLKATGTDGPAKVVSALTLEDFDGVIKQPEMQRTPEGTSRFRLEAPSLFVGGEDATKIINMNDPQIEGVLREVDGGENFRLNPAHEDAIEGKLKLPEEPLEGQVFSGVDLSGSGELSGMISPAMKDISQFSVNPSPSVMPGDVDTLKSYLALREQDVAVLTGQVRSSQERIQQLEVQLKIERARASELQHMTQRQEQKIKNFDQDKKIEAEVLCKQADDLSSQLKEKTDKLRSLEVKLKFTTDEIDKVKERVRVDIRRIRVREKELENQLEILKKDSTALLIARDEKIVELKRKLDLLEFNMELVQEQFNKERHVADDLRTRLKDAASVMRQAGGFLEQEV